MTLWTAACQAPLSMEFPREEYRLGCHFLLQGIFLTQVSNLQWCVCVCIQAQYLFTYGFLSKKL